jgi:aspartate/methionine/tyrosine aminotransferase
MQSKAEPDWRALIRPEIASIESSGIVEVFNYGRGRQGLIPLWVGEGDLPTPSFIAEAAKASIDRGETFYTYQAGIPDLRAAISAYMTAHYGSGLGPERFFVTIGGMHALDIAVRMTVGPGEEAIVLAPAWPNFAGALVTNGARAVFVELEAGASWRLDPARLEAAVTPQTRTILFNSPANPTGYVATREELVAVLDIARRRGLWIIADEIYGRISFSGERAPSFHDIMESEDRIIFVQTFSKNWAMTGLRIGWLEVPPELGQTVENLIQYSTSCVAPPLQRAGIAALEQGGGIFAAQLARMQLSRDILCNGLAETGRVHFARPKAAFYLFCKLEGIEDTRSLALRLIDEANVGVAPGTAFGPGAQQFVRICFARSPDEITEAVRRLKQWFAANS